MTCTQGRCFWVHNLKMSGAAGPPPACGAMMGAEEMGAAEMGAAEMGAAEMGAAEMGAGGRGRRARGHPDGHGGIQTDSG